ncbi:putative Tetratricopeptide repeat protein, partial [Daphnia magna]
ALEKLVLKAEQFENEQGTSLSKYFGQPGNTDDIFDSIVKPSRLADGELEKQGLQKCGCSITVVFTTSP